MDTDKQEPIVEVLEEILVQLTRIADNVALLAQAQFPAMQII